MIDDFRHIRAFLAVARVGNFTRAASELHLSQSALTVQIKQLEEALGATLFDRGKRRIALTPAGKDVLVPLEKILVDAEAVISRTREMTSLRRGMVTMAVLPSLAAQMVPRAVRSFRRQFPGIEVRIKDIVAEKIIEAVKKEEVDFGVGSRLRRDGDLRTRLLLVDKLAAFAPKGHPLAQQSSVTLADLRQYPLIVTGKESSVREIVEDALKREKLSFSVAFEANYMSTAVGLVKAGMGVAILPEALAETDNSGDVCPIAITRPTLSRKIEIIQRKDRSLSPAARRMVEVLKQAAAQPTR